MKKFVTNNSAKFGRRENAINRKLSPAFCHPSGFVVLYSSESTGIQELEEMVLYQASFSTPTKNGQQQCVLASRPMTSMGTHTHLGKGALAPHWKMQIYFL